MQSWLGAVVCAVILGSSAAAEALPVGLLSKTRLGPICADSKDTTAALNCWLAKHPTIAGAMRYHDGNFNGPWAAWPAAVKDELRTHFNEMVLFYRAGWPANFPEALSTPLTLLGPNTQPLNGHHLSEADGRALYLMLVANNLAAELCLIFPWSIAGYSQTDASMLLSMSDVVGAWKGPPAAPEAGYYFIGIGHAVPATPAYAMRFVKTNQLIGASGAETVGRLFAWARTLKHFSLEPGVNVSDLPTLYWGPTAPPIGAWQLIDGTIYTGPSGPTFGRYTAGCHGTMDFMKVMLQALNIPTRIWNTAQHATPYFPTLDLAMTHGDDPYDWMGYVSPVPGFAVPSPTQYFVSIATLNNLCNPAWPDPTWCEHKVGIMPGVIGILYGSDYLMDLHCQDLAAGKSHAASAVLNKLKWYWPEQPMAAVQQMLESVGLWVTLDAKVVAANTCS